jgi:hypothetical protein
MLFCLILLCVVVWSSTSRHVMHKLPHTAILNNTTYLYYFICNFITLQIRTGELLSFFLAQPLST